MHNNSLVKDPAISANETEPYPPYTEGVKKDVWIKNDEGDILFGKVLMTNNMSHHYFLGIPTSFPEIVHKNILHNFTHKLGVQL